MRCLSCNARLTEFEATRRGANTLEFVDLCNHCFASISNDVLTLERSDLEEEGYSTDNTDDNYLDYSIDNDDER
jgi:hypothetical protein